MLAGAYWGAYDRINWMAANAQQQGAQFMIRRRFFGAARLAAAIGALACAKPTTAGGGPENVVVVVNSASWASQTVANHFIQLRGIPPVNVINIDWTEGFEGTDGQTFRDKILRPVLQAIKRRGVSDQIDYIVYSSDLPYAVDLSSDLAGAKLTDQQRPTCSINSATFLWHLVFGKSALAMDWQSNRYMRFTRDREVGDPTHGFRSWYGWDVRGRLSEAGGQPYMLSTMLAMTSGRGNSVREAAAYLRASATADGTMPKGTIYFSKTEDVRSTTRRDQPSLGKSPSTGDARSKTAKDEFDVAVALLKKLGVRAEIIAQPMPAGRDNVQGAMTGTADYSWARTRSKILPGAICENFTSFGGILREGGSQTPLTEFLRYGAAGSSGTVVEPFAIWVKFPTPMLHVHYAQGCTLAEAYYQSVFAPAQLLIVGDPLCRPWANIPLVQVEGVKPGAKVSGTIELVPSATLPMGGKIDRFELFVDGRRLSWANSGATLSWDSTSEPDGYHELRVVGIEAGPIESQGRAIFGVVVKNHDLAAQLATMPTGTARWDETLKIRARAPSMSEIFIMHNDRALGRITGEQGQVDVNPRLLGLGPVTLQAVAVKRDGTPARIASAPLHLTIEPPKPLPALPDQPTNLARGLLLKLADGKTVPVQETVNPAWLAGNGVEANQPFSLQAIFDVPIDDVYQFQVWHFGDLKLTVDSSVVYNVQGGDYTQKFAPVSLAAGKHRLTIAGRTAEDTRLRILFGGPGALSLNGATFRHAR